MNKQTPGPTSDSFLSTKIHSYLELIRPANIVTAFADVLAGFAVAGGTIAISDQSLSIAPEGLLWLLLSTFGLYGGGVVFNDVYDADLDARERPERPIPSGRVSVNEASVLGSFLLLGGVVAAFAINLFCGAMAICIVVFALLYDAVAKQNSFWGPLIMGMCRGGNLMMGIAISPLVIFDMYYLPLLPIAYIAAITLVSKGEVHGGSRRTGWIGTTLVGLVLISLFALGASSYFELNPALPFILIFGLAVIPPFVKAAANPEAAIIKKTVKRGVISLILLNSVLAAGFSGWVLGFLVVILLPFSLLLGHLFAVT